MDVLRPKSQNLESRKTAREYKVCTVDHTFAGKVLLSQSWNTLTYKGVLCLTQWYRQIVSKNWFSNVFIDIFFILDISSTHLYVLNQQIANIPIFLEVVTPVDDPPSLFD